MRFSVGQLLLVFTIAAGALGIVVYGGPENALAVAAIAFWTIAFWLIRSLQNRDRP